MSETQTRLPCRYQVQAEEKVVQVTWFKVLPDGSKDHIIMAHFTDGHTGESDEGKQPEVLELHTETLSCVRECR